MIGGAIAKRKAVEEVAAGGDNVTVIPLDSVTSLKTRKSRGISDRLGGRNLLVTTAEGAAYSFGVKPDRWSAELASALTARGREVRTTPEGMVVTPAPGAGRQPVVF